MKVEINKTQEVKMTYRRRGTDSQGNPFAQNDIDRTWEAACEKMHNHELIEHALKVLFQEI